MNNGIFVSFESIRTPTLFYYLTEMMRVSSGNLSLTLCLSQTGREHQVCLPGSHAGVTHDALRDVACQAVYLLLLKMSAIRTCA